MNRLSAMLLCDLRLQWRNGFYAVTAFVLVFWLVLFSQLPGFSANGLLAGVLVFNLLLTSFYYIGGLVLLEKGEGTLEAQVVTPLRTGEYLASKLVTLAVLTLAENLCLVMIVTRLRFAVLPLVLGVLLAAGLLVLTGFLAVIRYDAINEYLLPSVGYMFVLTLPALALLLGWQGWGWYLHPLHAPLVLLRAAFAPAPAWEWAYGVGYSLLWLAAALAACRQAFHRFVVGREGVH